MRKSTMRSSSDHGGAGGDYGRRATVGSGSLSGISEHGRGRGISGSEHAGGRGPSVDGDLSPLFDPEVGPHSGSDPTLGRGVPRSLRSSQGSFAPAPIRRPPGRLRRATEFRPEQLPPGVPRRATQGASQGPPSRFRGSRLDCSEELPPSRFRGSRLDRSQHSSPLRESQGPPSRFRGSRMDHIERYVPDAREGCPAFLEDEDDDRATEGESEAEHSWEEPVTARHSRRPRKHWIAVVVCLLVLVPILGGCLYFFKDVRDDLLDSLAEVGSGEAGQESLSSSSPSSAPSSAPAAPAGDSVARGPSTNATSGGGDNVSVEEIDDGSSGPFPSASPVPSSGPTLSAPPSPSPSAAQNCTHRAVDRCIASLAPNASSPVRFSSRPVPHDCRPYLCGAYCFDCATSSPYDPTCTREERGDGTRLSQNVAVPREALAQYRTTYMSSGFAWCEAADCNDADACTGLQLALPGSGDGANVTIMNNALAADGGGDANVNLAGADLDAMSAPYVLAQSAEGPSALLSRYGFAVAVSGDGALVAVGAKDATHESTREVTGAVYLYSRETPSATSLGETTGPASFSLLQVLYGYSSRGEFGNAVALSRDGHRLVVGSRSENGQEGALRIYQREAGTVAASVNATGPSPDGDEALDNHTGMPDVNEALVNTIAQWSLMEGGMVSGPIPRARAGWAVSISANGNVVAMGSPKGGAIGGGSILAFKYNDLSSKWDQYGSEIQGLSWGEAAGYALSLSDTGSRMVVGSSRAVNLLGARNAGKTTIYVIDGWDWQASGPAVYGDGEGDADGAAVAMSRDGSVVAIGGKGHSTVKAFTGEIVLASNGRCRVYIFRAGAWEFQHVLEGTARDEQLGSSVAVSPDGNVVACGGSYGVREDGAEKSGVVRLWNRATLQESTLWPRGDREDAEGSTFGTSIALSGEGECVIAGAPTWGFKNGGPSASVGAIQIFGLPLPTSPVTLDIRLP